MNDKNPCIGQKFDFYEIVRVCSTVTSLQAISGKTGYINGKTYSQLASGKISIVYSVYINEIARVWCVEEEYLQTTNQFLDLPEDADL